MRHRISSLLQHSSLNLTTRILLLQLFWALLVYLLVIAALWLSVDRVIENNVRRQGESLINKLDELGTPVYASSGPAQISEAIIFAKNTPEILSARYMDSSGRKIKASYTRKNTDISSFGAFNQETIEKLKRTEDDKRPLLFEKGKNFQMRVSAPIWIKSISADGMINFSLNKKKEEKIENIGFIDLILDYSALSQEINHNLTYANLIIAILMIVATLIGRKLVKWALRPLSDLKDPLSRLARGETNVIVKTSGDTEIAQIGIALNTTINAIRERDETLIRMANQDNLTGLANRKYFVEQLEKEISRIAKGGSSALFFFDLDRFKYINDTYGHAAGDRLLIQVANVLKQRARGKDLAARFGGDEFTLLAYNTDGRGAKELAEDFIQLMHEFDFYEAGTKLKIHFSIGIAMIDDATQSSQDFLKAADSAVHEAKSRGRNGYVMYNRKNSSDRTEHGTGWYEKLQNTLDNHTAIPHFQSLKAIGKQDENIQELLLRIPDSKQGILTANACLPLAERFGLMAGFDRLMISQAVDILNERKDSTLVLSVNISLQFIEDKGSMEFLSVLLKNITFKPEQLVFELPEHLIIRNMEVILRFLPELEKTGIRTAIDDFGSGFCAYSHLKNMPVHFLKIDSALIEQVSSDPLSRIMVKSIAEIATQLHMQTVAKFVPDQASLNSLKKIGIDYAQGNFISPVSEQLDNPT